MTAQRMMPSTSGLRPTLRITSMESPPPIRNSVAESPQRAATEMPCVSLGRQVAVGVYEHGNDEPEDEPGDLDLLAFLTEDQGRHQRQGMIHRARVSLTVVATLSASSP